MAPKKRRAGAGAVEEVAVPAPGSSPDTELPPEPELPGGRKRRSTRLGQERLQSTHLPPLEAGSPTAMGTPMGDHGNDGLMDAVVKVFCVHCEPNFSLPWQRKRQYSSNSSGFVICTDRRRILTNAHSVEHHTQVKVKRRGSDEKFVASVLSVGTECDIAMLTVKDDKFWEGIKAVRFGELPRLQDAVTVIGFPIGGDTMSVTQGVVSRIEVTAYVHGASELLGIQIDAAINSGNSGGPAFNDVGECVGIAFQSLKHEDAENIGYVIPTPVIHHFINDFDTNGAYTGFPALGLEWQKMENPHLREALSMRKEQKGVLIRRVEPTASVAKVIHQGDILLKFDGVQISNDGTVPFRSGERISFSYLISEKYTTDTATLELIHKGKVKVVKTSLGAPNRLIPVHIRGKPPSYYILAGMVFTPVCVPYMRSEYGKEYDFDAPVKLLDKMMHTMADHATQQVVVLGQVLASDITIGYEDIVNTQVLKCNGLPVNNLEDLANAVESCKAKYLRLDLEYNQVVVLDNATAREATKAILETHCIPAAMSEDLRLAVAANNGKTKK
mmetsp:Transcript_35789/g.90257  ORF Transcript_35789/g.90257 Transcript_35789/m.90257 type:complete len:557 (-) Transcript_35789:239-1909(-)